MERVMDTIAGSLRRDGELGPNGEQRPSLHRPKGRPDSTDAEAFVIGPEGERLTRADLPEANTSRWVPRRKARVVAAVEGGLVTREWALERYRLTAEELDSWKSGMARFGMRGLCVTKLGRRRGAAS